MSGTPDFPSEYTTPPPTPLSPTNPFTFAAEDAPIPSQFHTPEHTATVGDWPVLRGGITCERCDSNVFLHPESLIPPNTVHCFNCSWSPMTLVWWADTTLDAFTEH